MFSNIKMEVNDKNNLTFDEQNKLQKKYYELFMRMYGKDVYDSILSFFKEDTKFYNFLASFSHNNYLSNKVVNDLNDAIAIKKISFLTARYNNDLLAVARLRKIDEVSASIPDVVFFTSERYKLKLWKEILLYVENYFKASQYLDMYVEVPINDFTLLSGCFDRGFTECDGASKTHLLGKKLERINK